MNTIVKYLIILIAVSGNYAQDEVNAAKTINPGGPMIPADPPAWPPACCNTRFGCDSKTLSQYCLPVPCPKIGCIGSETCTCLFPGTTQIISPRKETTVPRAPFCSNKPDHVCPLALFKCPDFKCPTTPIECTASQIQKMID